ncbi:TspO/MBR family protein [Pokkaliibacter sp. CJK22405]|uniref:TspO/MBR family protein n=1 Tax=Pokkaliibacter sp. CJK22405 TaxID=3384615 RepID=UPI0039848B38
MSKHLPAYAGWTLLVFITAALGAWASVDARSFYASLNQPSWAPPGGVFGPVWTLLYIMMAVAVCRIWRQRHASETSSVALSLFVIQLVLNGLWSWLFFAWHLGLAAFVDVIVLWVFIFLTLRSFQRTDKLAAWLLLPYLVWVAFATALTFAVWQANPGIL